MPTEVQVLAAVTQGGSFLLLAWLAIYGLPTWIRSEREEREKLLDLFSQQQQYEREQCQKQFERLAVTMERQQSTLQAALEGLSRQIAGNRGVVP